ncbi:hypothetical protein KCU79_g21020, partial [Aureobasidium melanogenum]
ASRAGAASKSSVRDAIMAARKKAQAESRPNSAMATVSPASVRSKSSNNLSARQPSAGQPASARVPSAASTSSSTSTSARPNALMSGAARRPVRRPEIARPATADPYASRRLARPETPSIKSPVTSPRQEIASTSVGTSASKTRTDGGSPALSPFRQSYLSPRSAANRTRPSSRDSKTEEPAVSKEDEFASFVPTSYKSHLPISPNSTRSHLPTSPRSTLRRPTLNGSASVDSVIPVVADDTFSMELPTVHRSHVPVFERRASHLSTVDPTIDAQPSEPQHTRRTSDRNDSPVTISHQPSPQREVSPAKPAGGAASPLPTLAPAAQIESASPQAEEAAFQIHEDPFMEGIEASEAQKAQQSQDARSVLGEVPVNEFSQVATAESSNREEMPRTEDSPPQSPQTKSETLRSRKLLMSGIERIRGRTLDAHGFRKVLELIKSSESGEIFGSVGEGRRFDDLCSVLLDYIVESSDVAANPAVRHSQELRRQATSVMRTVLNAQQPPYRKWIASGRWYPRALTGALDARKNVEGSGLLVKDL